MRISFDLDETLIIPNSTSVEPINFFVHITKSERLRLGTRRLFRELKKSGHEIWIYTSSERSVSKIKTIFFFHGLILDGVINGIKHRKQSELHTSNYSKNPLLFNIDLHIDDSDGVLLEAAESGSNVLKVLAKDKLWVDKILNEVNRVTYHETKVSET